MNMADPNGQLRAYRRESDRRDSFVMLAIGAICGLTFVGLAWELVTHYW